MKSLLLSIASLTAIAPTNSIFFNHVSNIRQLNNQPNQISNEQTGLFNNQYNYLSSSNLITNQSKSNQQFYSYDISHANYLLSNGVNARTLFIVDEQGNLVYKSDAKIPSIDLSKVNNTKAEIIQTCVITAAKDTSNFISNSQYSDQYFNSGFKDWQYIQFGGRENHISIAGQQGAEKVQFFDQLSESLGLYYIAKATKISGGIDQTVAEQLGKYFIEKSSLKGKLSQDLINQMIKLISTDDKIYQLIANSPFTNSDQLYSLNFIFNHDNELIEVYYQKWNQLNTITNYQWNHIYQGSASSGTDSSNDYLLLKWTDFASDWTTFITKFPTYNFNQSALSLKIPGDIHTSVPTTKSTNFSDSFDTSKIAISYSSGNTNSVYNMSVVYKYVMGMFEEEYDATFDLNMWHDNQNIYYRWFLSHNAYTEISLKLNITSFNLK